ncbi:preprotein translocase subunit YajC [Desmospora activa]|uniref:Preprotein translocase subunit YajC n=1 Tax=Desmospora activa DSM 45169 TaxID=1121389 RepID=A0A2T4Z8W3_9BACL|nr:preprotein translocase subunit YajC [Desmospora activa]PTM58326.1 preprotein translocase subunit YajC [Desmospora activa DSM 45169]
METLASFLPLILIFAVFYFLLLRPQQKRQKERNTMLSSLKKGDKVITIGGLHGTIMDLNDERISLKVNENTRLTFERSSVNAVVNEDESTSENS